MTQQQELIVEATEAVELLAKGAAAMKVCLRKAMLLDAAKKGDIRTINLSHRLKDALRTAETACQSINTTLKYAKQAVDAENPVPELRVPGA